MEINQVELFNKLLSLLPKCNQLKSVLFCEYIEYVFCLINADTGQQKGHKW